MSEDQNWKRDELRKLREEAALTVANLEGSRDAIENELKVARLVLERVEQELRDNDF